MEENSQKKVEVNDVSVSEENIKDKKSKEQEYVKNNKKIIISFISILILLVALFAIYNFIFCNPKNIFLRAVNSQYQKLDNQLDKIVNSDINESAKNKTISTNSKLDFDLKMNEDLMSGTNYEDLIEEINKLNLEMDTVIDNKNKKFSYDIKAKYENNDLINVLAYGQEKSIYFELKDLFDKYIEIPVEEYDALFEANESIDDSRYIIKTAKDSFLNNLEEKDFIKTSTKTDVNGKSVNTKKITYSLDEKKALKLVKAVLTDLKENKKFIEKCANVTGKDKKDVKESIQDAIENIEDEIEYVIDSDEKVELSVYIEGILNKVVKYEMRFISDDEKISLSYSSYKDVTIIEVTQDNEKLLTSKTTKESKDTYKTMATIDSIDVVIDSKISDTENTHKYTITEENADMKISGELTTTNKEVKKNKEYNGNVKFSLKINAEDEEVASIVVNGKSTSKIGQKVKIPDLNDSVLYDQLTENDLNTIMKNLVKNENMMNFINNISKSLSSTSNYSNY